MLGLEQQQRPGQQVKDSCPALSAPLRVFAEQRVCAQKSPGAHNVASVQTPPSTRNRHLGLPSRLRVHCVNSFRVKGTLTFPQPEAQRKLKADANAQSSVTTQLQTYGTFGCRCVTVQLLL